jgi:UDP-N-acetylmuramate--alanine ligase
MRKHVHFVGIGGAGLSALARIMLARGWLVSGSDRTRSKRTIELGAEGVTIFIGHQAESVSGADVVVVSSAIPADNPERVAAEAAGIPVLKRDRWLADITQGYKLIAIAGTHGKTTTTSMIAFMLTDAGLDPTVVVGGEVPQLGGNARTGTSNLFVLEADEYDYAFLGLHPTIGVVLNIEHDHPDIFADLAAVQNTFGKFLQQVDSHGTIVGCVDDKGVREVLGKLNTSANIASYGLEENGTWRATELKNNAYGGTDFVVIYQGESFGTFRLLLPGRHAVLNALAAIAVGKELALQVSTMQDSLARFIGVERRFQYIGAVHKIDIFDDYAHHPTEIRATLAAARQQFGERPLWVIFQPHTFSRLEKMYNDFLNAFKAADYLVVTNVYAAREEGDNAEVARVLAEAIEYPPAIYEATPDDILHYLLHHLPDNAIVLTLGAGDITHLGPRLHQALHEARL